MAANDKFKKLVALLHKKTKAGMLDWLVSGEKNVQVNIAGRTVVISKTGEGFTDPLITIHIFNDSANLIDRFTDEQLSDIIPYITDSAFNIMDELYQMALHKATGVDENLDAILDALNDDPPF